MLLELPDYSGPYDLTVVSFRRGIGLTTEIFVPSGLYFDAEFQQVGAFGEEQLDVRRRGVLSNEGTDSLVAELTFGEANRASRYLLLYTQGNLVGQRTSYGWRAQVERSLEASIEVATSPLPAQPEVARSFAQLQALVEVGQDIRVFSGPGRTVRGSVVSLSSSLVLLANDEQLDLQEGDVRYVERRGDFRWDGDFLRIGLYAGGVVGFVCALVCGDICIDIDDSDGECPPRSPRTNTDMWGYFLATAAPIVGVGAAIQWATRGWTLVYDRPARPAATATLSPIISGNQTGARLTVGF